MEFIGYISFIIGAYLVIGGMITSWKMDDEETLWDAPWDGEIYD